MINVLVVEDSKDVRYSIKTALESFKKTYTVVEACSAEDCFKKLKTFMPDVILMDIMMPGMDGVEAAKKLKNDEKYSKIKIIFLTAKNDSFTKGTGRLTGEDFIVKPFDSANLDARIKASLTGIKKIDSPDR
ncbi:MAG: response regulator [bacterium]